MSLQTSTSYEWNTADKKEKKHGISLTVPGQSMSPRQYKERFQAGQSVPEFVEYAYLGEEDQMPEYEKMDKIERIQAIAEIREDMLSQYPKNKKESWLDYEQRILKEKKQALLNAEKALAEAANNAKKAQAETKKTDSKKEES